MVAPHLTGPHERNDRWLTFGQDDRVVVTDTPPTSSDPLAGPRTGMRLLGPHERDDRWLDFGTSSPTPGAE